jgi:hypothetical protein
MAKKKPAKKPKATKGTGAEDRGRALKSRIDASGKNTRVKGHLSASTRRSQAKRDSKNA